LTGIEAEGTDDGGKHFTLVGKQKRPDGKTSERAGTALKA